MSTLSRICTTAWQAFVSAVMMDAGLLEVGTICTLKPCFATCSCSLFLRTAGSGKLYAELEVVDRKHIVHQYH